MRRSRWIVPALLALLVLTGGVYLVAGERILAWATGAGQQAQNGSPGARAVPVRVGEVQRGEVRESTETTGEFRARENVVVTTDAEGLVRSVAFEEGELVEEGQLLVRLDAQEEEAQLGAARAERERIARDLERARQLAQEEFGPEARVDQLEAELAQAEAEIEVAKAALEERSIEAPFSGWIGLRQVSPGSLITPGTPVAELWSVDPIDLAFDVPADFLPRLRRGQAVLARSDALPGGEAEGKVTVIEDAVDRATRTVTLKAAFENPDGQLPPGAFAAVELVLEVREDAPLIPEEALLRRGDDAYVFVIGEDGTARRRLVATGERRDGLVEVTDGLEGAERIVVAGLQRLSDGQKVRPVQAPGEGEGDGDGRPAEAGGV